MIIGDLWDKFQNYFLISKKAIMKVNNFKKQEEERHRKNREKQEINKRQKINLSKNNFERF